PTVYSSVWGYDPDGQIWQFLASLIFVHEFWFMHVATGSDLPYWSLGYEVWYYVIFGLFLFARHRVVWSVLAMVLVGPAILAMFPLWLCGVAAFRIVHRQRISRRLGFVLWIGSITGWVCYEIWAARQGRLVDLVPDWLRRPMLVEDYLVGAIFTVNLIGFAAVGPVF